jgi:HlyD family secretion protein
METTTGTKIETKPAAVKKRLPTFVFVILLLVAFFVLKIIFDFVFDTHRLQGYVEGEFTYISPAVAGRLQKLSVERGATVKEGDALFHLDRTPKQSSFDEAKGKLAQAEAALELSQKDYARQKELLTQSVDTQQALDRAVSTRDQNLQSVEQMKAALANAEWEFNQTEQKAPAGGIVFDTLYREGEWVAMGSPVVALLTPKGIRVRVYIDEKLLSQTNYGDRAKVYLDGLKEPFEGKVVYIAPKSEYTPPIIYSQESRSKFVWRVDIGFDNVTAMKLHPGQPVEIKFVKGK